MELMAVENKTTEEKEKLKIVVEEIPSYEKEKGHRVR